MVFLDNALDTSIISDDDKTLTNGQTIMFK